jgi:ferrochelatase
LAGILLLAHGGPASLEDLPAFLGQVRGGRPCSEALLEETRERYRHIGGASPLPGITRSTAGKLAAQCGTPTYVGMLHWPPMVEDAVAQMAADGITEALAICLVPQYSGASIGRYRKRTVAAAAEHGLVCDFVEDWHTAAPYIEGLTASVAGSCKDMGCEPGSYPYVIFSAHSLPKVALPEGDPYDAQLRETASLVAANLGLGPDMWSLAYQSVSGPAAEWLGPSLDSVVTELAGRGITEVVVCPFGFLADQVEILYDLDFALKNTAAGMGVSITRTPLLNDGPAVVDSLAGLVEGWKR